MSNDSIEPGTSADAYELDDTEPSVATSEQSDTDAALAANEYPYESASAEAEEDYPPTPGGLRDPAQDYVEAADYGGGLADIGLADPEIEQVLEESDYGDPEYSNPEDLSAAGNPGPGTQATPENVQFPEGSGNPGPDLDSEEPSGAVQYPSGSGNPGPGNSEVVDPEPSGSGNLGPNPDDIPEPGVGIGEFVGTPMVPGLAAVPGLMAAMPPIPPGGLPQPPAPGPDIPQPQVPDTDDPEPPIPDTELPEPPVPGGGLGNPAPTPGLSAEPTIPLPGAPGLTGGPGITGARPPLRLTESDLPRGAVLMIAAGIAGLLALEFISIAVVLGLSELIGPTWSMLAIGATWFVGAVAFALAGSSKPARRGAEPSAVRLSGMRERLA